MPLGDVIAFGRTAEFEFPPGLIFHLSRCGSTLIAESLRLLDNCRVVSEPKALTDLFQAKLDTKDRAFALRGLVHYFHRGLCCNQEKLVVKFTSWLAAFFPDIQAALTESRSCFLIRNPLEILVSLVDSPPAWFDVMLGRGPIDPEQVGRESSSLEDPCTSLAGRLAIHSGMSREELCARFLGLACQSMASTMKRAAVIEYQNLLPQLFSRISPLFEIDINGLEASRIRMTAQLNPKTGIRFRDDSQSKLARATPKLLETVDRFATPHYKQLLATSIEQANKRK